MLVNLLKILCISLIFEFARIIFLGNQGKPLPDRKHKEEYAGGRIKSDSVDCEKIRSSLQQCIHPLQIESHASNTLVNVYTGEESEPSSNVNKASEIGESQMQQFKNDLPGSFREKLTSKVVLMSSTRDKKKNRKNDAPSYNLDLIFSRVLLLLGTQQIQFDDVFKFELASVPTSSFHDNGDPRYPRNKIDFDELNEN